jgi:hypothetical protein
MLVPEIPIVAAVRFRFRPAPPELFGQVVYVELLLRGRSAIYW